MDTLIDRISDQLQKPQKIATLGVLAVVPVLAFLGFYGWSSYQKSLEARLTSQLFAIESEYQASVKKLLSEKTEGKSKEEKDRIESSPVLLSSEEFNLRFGGVEGKFRDFISKNAGSRVAALASFILLDIYQKYGIEKFDTELLEVAIKAREPLGSFAKIKLGIEWMNRGRCEQALPLWDDLIRSKKVTDLLADQAHLKKAACLIEKGDSAGARILLEPLARKETQSPIKELSSRYLRALDL